MYVAIAHYFRNRLTLKSRRLHDGDGYRTEASTQLFYGFGAVPFIRNGNNKIREGSKEFGAFVDIGPIPGNRKTTGVNLDSRDIKNIVKKPQSS
ncbi:MAG: hypothetical protein EOM54_03405 [Clostridia bacterium]|nr:hypothetical protein [Clostridia bacterium]